MRTLLILTTLLAASGARSQTLAERIVGNWADADSVAQTVYDENGDEIIGEDGSPAFVRLILHLSVTDSSVTSTSVSRNEGDLRGWESTSAYTLRGDTLYSDGETPVRIEVHNDSLVFSRTDSLGVRTDYAYARAVPLRPPEALLGDWISAPLTDDAGVIFDLPFRFRADGTFLSGASEPLAYRVLGPYLLTYDTTLGAPNIGAPITAFNVATLDLRDDRVILQASDDETFVLHRR